MPDVGYRDWQRVSYSSGFPIFNVFQAVGSTYTSSIVNVQAWDTLQIQLTAQVASDVYLIDFIWYEDQAGSTQTYNWQAVVGPQLESVVSIPVQGPYVQLNITPLVGGNAAKVGVIVWGASQRWGSYELNTVNLPLMDVGVVLAANQTKDATGTFFHWGSVVVTATTFGTGQAWIRLFTTAGPASPAFTVARLGVQNVSNATPYVLSLPPGTINVECNNGSVAQTVFVTVGPHSSS